MANDKVSNMSAAVLADLAGTTTGFSITSKLGTVPVTKSLTMSLLRTTLFAGGTGYTASDPLTCGAITSSGALAIGGALSGVTTATMSGPLLISGAGRVETNGANLLDLRPLAGGAVRVLNTAASVAQFSVAEATGNTAIGGTLAVTGAAGINGKTPVTNVAAPTAAGATYTATEQALLNDIRTRLINFGIYT